MQSFLTKRCKTIIISVFLLILTISIFSKSPKFTFAETITPEDVFDEDFDQYVFDFMEAVELGD